MSAGWPVASRGTHSVRDSGHGHGPHQDRPGADVRARVHLAAHPFASVNYWAPDQDTCPAECRAERVYDDDVRTAVWQRFKDAPAPVGYDPAIIPVWTEPTAPTFAALRLEPWRLRTMPGTVTSTSS